MYYWGMHLTPVATSCSICDMICAADDLTYWNNINNSPTRTKRVLKQNSNILILNDVSTCEELAADRNILWSLELSAYPSYEIWFKINLIDIHMRWIKERSESLLQLRCIEVNNDWNDFILYVHDKTNRQMQQKNKNSFLKDKIPSLLPTYGLNR